MNLARHTTSMNWAPDDGGSAAPASGGGGESAPTSSSGASASGTAPASATPPAGGSESTPANGAAPAASNPPSPAAGDPFNVFEAFDKVFDASADSSAPTADGVDPAPAVPPEQQPEVAPEATPPAKAPEAPKVEPAAPEVPAPATESPPLDLANPEGMLEQLRANEPQIIAMVAKEMFQLSAEDREAMETDFAGALPALGAKVYVKAMQSAMAQVAKIVPAMISRHLEQSKVGESVEQEFLKAWPQLDKAKHGAEIAQTAKLYKQLNPKATKEETFQAVGMMVAMKNGLLSQTGQAPQTPGVAPVAPARSAPFTPALGGGGSPSTRTVAVSEWDGLSQ
jgi:hypothetical protein